MSAGLPAPVRGNLLGSALHMNHEEQQFRLKELIARGKEQGYLTYGEVNDHLPDTIVDPEQIEDIITMINDMGIRVHEQAPDVDALLLTDGNMTTDEDAAEEAAAALVSVDADFGRTTDPVRMYMREMGTVELLTREGEIRIAKRIEDGLSQALFALAHYPQSIATLLDEYAKIEAGETKLADVLVRFIDPNATDSVVEHGNGPKAAPDSANDTSSTHEAGDGGGDSVHAGSRQFFAIQVVVDFPWNRPWNLFFQIFRIHSKG